MTDAREYRRGDPVALFVPCFVDVFNPEAARAVVTVLERLGVRLEYPLEQTCCGQPAYNAGHFAPAHELADRFARVFDGYSWIVTPSGSCAAMARVGFADLSPSSSLASTILRRSSWTFSAYPTSAPDSRIASPSTKAVTRAAISARSAHRARSCPRSGI